MTPPGSGCESATPRGFFCPGAALSDRTVIFIDGNNWYHALKDKKVGVPDLGRLDYRRISQKLVGPRTWLGTRYYIGRMDQSWNARDYAAQRAFLASLEADDPARISVHLGRLERRWETDTAASELLRYLAGLTVRIDQQVYHDTEPEAST